MLHPGLYEQVINNQLTSELSSIPEARKAIAPIDKAEASRHSNFCLIIWMESLR